MMDRNDPRLTAFALGEMDAAERAAFEKELDADPAARAEVEAIRALGGRLREELADAPAPALTDAQRASVGKAAARKRVPVLMYPLAVLLPVAAALMGVVVYLATRAEEPEMMSRRLEEAKSAEREEERRSNYVALAGGRRINDEPESEPTDTPGFRGPNGTVPPGIRKADEAPGDFIPPQITLVGVDEASEAPLFGDKKKRGDAGAPTTPAEPQGPQPTLVLMERPGEAPAAGAVDGRDKEADELIAAQQLMKEAVSLSDAARIREAYERLARQIEARDREGYDRIRENPFLRVAEEDSSTFSIDVDTASYANVRRFLLQENRLPPPDAVRIEEMVNYFSYAYEPPAAGSPDPFRIHVEVAQCPWETSHRLARVAIKGKVIDHRERPSSNLVFLVDVSGSMDQPNKLPLVQASLRLLAENLGERDRVAIVVYAGAAGLVLPSTGDKRAVIEAIDRLRAGGSTAGAAGIQLAYETAAASFLKDGTNRVILCTDGDFNVGISDDGSLTRFIEEKAKTGVFLSVLGFGTGNYQDGKMQQLADKGNGNHAYIDSILEARKILLEEMSGTLVTIAKDVKIQVFFNPKRVAGFRLIGYENRLLAKQDFNDDTKDAGEIGAGHSVTALYELVLAGSEVNAAPPVDENPFVAKAQAAVDSDALFQLRLRYKEPDGDASKLLESMVRDDGKSFDGASPDFRWAGAVAAFGMALRDAKTLGLDAILEIAKGTAGDDKYRQEFLKLVETAKLLNR